MPSIQTLPHPQKGIAKQFALALSCIAILCMANTTPAQTLAAATPATVGAKDGVAPTVLRSVSLITPKIEAWPDQIDAHGNIMPWQEARVDSEIAGQRLISVLANAGDIVKKGQALAKLDPASVEAELDAVNAQLMEAQAAYAQAQATLERAKRLAPSGGVSQQELTQYETQKQTAQARLNAIQARVKTQQLKLDSLTLLAPDDGVISSCTAVEGTIVQVGTELFRLIRKGRLEWRAEIKGETLIKLSAGQEVTVQSPQGLEFTGRVRQLSPTIDLKTQTGLAYIDLPTDTNFKAGLHLSGTLTIQRNALVLPAAAVQHRGDRDQVFIVGSNNKVKAIPVRIGRVQDEQKEITAGLNVYTKVIGSDVDSLKPGEIVTVQEAVDKSSAAQNTTPAEKKPL
ncbi:efflux RND transporter periplasmic adaptor subunit [Uliginosibacterium gangwonense]|uniref:efflux RND transporter periplasmic adaptor subunit n=1 Tax=Uliginosibacterium gangwonense TaxID=392736 RepID=UPI000363CA65|nr:efflux RND transporter periplasmic adaptor subunit [Uliginosibacterium gangwonense]